MDSQNHSNLQQTPGGKSHGAHVCTKCGWNYPNPHPSAKTRRAHKKICGTIKGYEIFDSEKAKENLDLQEEHCFDDEPKTPSPRVVKKADERIGDDISEEDVFADAVCEFSCSTKNSFKEKEETTTNCAANTTKNSGETQQCNMKSSEMVQESSEVPPMEVVENYAIPSSVEPVSNNRQGVDSYTKGHSMASETLTELSLETISAADLETERKGNLHITHNSNLLDESGSKLAMALEKTEDSSDATWNDDVIFSDLKGPHGFAIEATSMIYPGDADYVAIENADVPLQEIQGLEEFKSNHSVNSCLHETHKEDKCETDTLTQAENLRIQHECLSIVTEIPFSDKLHFEGRTGPQNQTDLNAVKELPCAENKLITKIVPEKIKMKDEEGESSFAAAQETVESETVRSSLPAADHIVVDSNADVSHATNKTAVVELIGHENELIEANVVAEEGNSPNNKLSSEDFKGDDDINQMKILKESNDKACKGSFINETNTKEYPIRHSGSTGTELDDTAHTEFNRIVGGLGVIQGNEIAGDVKAHNSYAEVPVTIESNDHRDFGRLQNLSEAHIRSLVSSPLVTRNKFESNSRSVSGVSGGVNKPESATESKNQEITMEKTTRWSTMKEQHIPLKNLLNEARSPKDNHESNIPRVSSILGQETSPEEDGWPERKEVSEKWNSPAKYPVDLKRKERKVKGKPFWVPFVCCSSFN